MYVVARYYNYWKDPNFKIISIVENLHVGKRIAREYAYEEYGGRMVEAVAKRHMIVDSVIEYTQKDGYDCNVYCVIKVGDDILARDDKDKVATFIPI